MVWNAQFSKIAARWKLTSPFSEYLRRHGGAYMGALNRRANQIGQRDPGGQRVAVYAVALLRISAVNGSIFTRRTSALGSPCLLPSASSSMRLKSKQFPPADRLKPYRRLSLTSSARDHRGKMFIGLAIKNASDALDDLRLR